jgi:cytoskeletal protein RodZ
MNEEKGVLGLTAIRRNRGITLEQIAESTKISIRSLEAIEQGEFRRLPGGIYNTSYIRQYAKAIDYDEATLLAFYQREMARADDGAQDGTKRNGMYGHMRTASSLFGS